MTWTKVFNAQGPAGAQLRTGSGAPASSLGNVGDTYVDTTSTGAPIFYAAKTSSGWPSSGQSLVGAAGLASTWYYGTAIPGQQFLKNVNDLYLQTTTADVYQLTSTGWIKIANILGGIGPQGLSVLSGSGAPSSSLGVQNQPGYIDTTNGILYGAKGASSWPSGISLNGLSIRNGSGAPTSTKPTVQFDGDFYVDTSANVIYGPRASGTWPSSGVSFAGNTIRTGSGAPSSSLGATGDLYIDGSSGLLYSKATGSWVATGGNLTGPQGNTGLQGFSSLTNQAACYYGMQVSFNQTLSSTAQIMQSANTGAPSYIMFAQASAFMGATIANSGGSATITLVDTTNNSVVWSSGAVTSNYSSGLLSTTTYPLVANRLYQFMVSGSGTSNILLNPTFLQPSVLSNVGAGILSGFTTPASTTLSSTTQYFYPNSTLNTSSNKPLAYTPIRAGGLLGAIGLYIPSTAGAAAANAVVTMYAYNQSGSAGPNAASFTIPNDGVPHALPLGTVAALATAVTYYVGVTGTGTGLVDVKFQLVV